MNDKIVLEKIGRNIDIVALLGLRSTEVVSNWKRRGIPPAWRPAVFYLAVAKGIELDQREFLRIKINGSKDNGLQSTQHNHGGHKSLSEKASSKPRGKAAPVNNAT